jgi:hypothetical protein
MATGLYIKTFCHTYLLLLTLIIIIQYLIHSLSICKTSGLSKKYQILELMHNIQNGNKI